jgi:prepilin-type N-terminal cleavage/methylation domain-containing protein
MSKNVGPSEVEHGFTIVELMIATSILSIMLILATSVMISISNLYYKGITTSRTQDNARSIASEVSGRLKYNGDPLDTAQSLNHKVNAYCIGTTRYIYLTGQQLGGSPFQHVLWRDNNGVPGACFPAPPGLSNGFLQGIPPGTSPSAGGTELIAPGSMLTGFTISHNSDSSYTVDVGVAYGDGTLLTPNSPITINSLCSGATGDSFCATSTQVTTVSSRL